MIVNRSDDEPTTNRQRTSGSVASGIRILTAAASKINGTAKIYNEGVAAGACFDDIEKALKQINGCPAYPLRPSNSPYFTVHQSQFTAPGVADRIMELYGEKRDGELHLYSFPIIFRQNDIDAVLYQRFEAWSGGGKLRWSEDEGQPCMKFEELKPDKNRRRRRGGREIIADRQRCDPNDCEFYQGKQQTCFEMSSLYFFIPGVPGTGLIDLTFKSFYGKQNITHVLRDVQAGMGFINGLYKNEPIFTVSKRYEEVSVMDWETGKPSRRMQHIINIDAVGIDMFEFLQDPELPAPQPAALLTHLHDADDNVIDTATGEIVTDEDIPPGEYREVEPEPTRTRMTEEVKKLRRQLKGIVDKLGWTPEDMQEYVTGNYPGVAEPTHDEPTLIDMCAKLAVMV